MLQAAIGKIEVRGVEHPVILRQVRLSALIFPARLEETLVGVVPADDLHHVEPLGAAVGRQFLEAFPGEPLAEALPPRIAQPEERRAIGVLEVPSAGAGHDETVFEQRVRPFVGRSGKAAFGPVQVGVALVAALEAILVLSLSGRGEADRPPAAPGPEGRDDPPLVALLKHGVHLDIGEGVGILLGGFHGLLKDGPLWNDVPCVFARFLGGIEQPAGQGRIAVGPRIGVVPAAGEFGVTGLNAAEGLHRGDHLAAAQHGHRRIVGAVVCPHPQVLQLGRLADFARVAAAADGDRGLEFPGKAAHGVPGPVPAH